MIMIVLRLGCQHCMARFRPDFLGLGVQKGGTTSLDAMLRQHPDVLLPDRKELQFFSLHYNLGEAWYGGQFAAAQPGQCCGEITPYYLFHPLAPARIRDLLPEVKLIVLLRDPVERALSQLFHSKRLGVEPLEPEQALLAEVQRLRDAEAVIAAGGRHRSHQEHSYVARSRYELQLARYEALFPADQMLLLCSEDFFDDPNRVWQRLLTFLNLKPVPVPVLPRANAGRKEANALSAELRLLLKQHLLMTYALIEQRYGLVWPL